MTQYAQISDLTTYGLPAVAIGPNLSPTTLNGILTAVSTKMDSYFRGRYALPFVTFDVDVVECCAKIAAFEVLRIRGYDPENAGDKAVKDGHDEAIKWLDKVQRQQAHPNVTPQPSQSPTYQQPFVQSQSVVNVATGQTAPNRGW